MVSTTPASQTISYQLFKYLFIIFCLVAALFPLIINAKHYINDLLWQHTQSTDGTFLYSGLWGGILIYLSTAKDKKIPIVTTIISSIVIIALTIHHQQTWKTFFALIDLTAFISYLVCVVYSTRNLICKKTTAQQTPLAYFFLPLFIILSSFGLYYTTPLTPHIDDQLLYTLDATLGFYPTFFMGKLFASLSLLPQIAIYIIYATLPFIWAVVYLKNYHSLQREPISLIKEAALGALLGLICYLIIPACGPADLFGSNWPWQATALQNLSVIAAPRNCMPSLHVTLAYFIWRHTQVYQQPMRMIFTLWFILLILSTMMLGQHYLIDIIVALPFVTLIRGICASSFSLSATPRLQAILIGGSLFCGWMLLILFGLPLLRWSPIIPWILYVGTILAACISEHRLAYANLPYAAQTHHLTPAYPAVNDSQFPHKQAP